MQCGSSAESGQKCHGRIAERVKRFAVADSICFPIASGARRPRTDREHREPEPRGKGLRLAGVVLNRYSLGIIRTPTAARSAGRSGRVNLRITNIFPSGMLAKVSEMETPTAVPHEPHAEVCCGGGDEGHGCATGPGVSAVRPGPLDGCPTPLAWQQVLTAFREQTTAIELPRKGYTLQARTWGEGPPLYFLCGMGGTAETFCLVTYLLRDLFRCVVFDYPGTREVGCRVTLPSLRDDLLALADQQGDREFNLFATSFGGLVALETLLTAPERVSRAVLQGAFAYRHLSSAERLLVRLGGILPGRIQSLPGTRAIQEQNHRRWFPNLDASRWQFFLEDAGQIPARSLARRGAIIRDTDFRPQLARISQPVLLIQSEGDGLVTRECHEALVQGLPQGQGTWMHSSGHLPHLTSPHRLAKLLRDFLLPKPAPTDGQVSAPTA